MKTMSQARTPNSPTCRDPRHALAYDVLDDDEVLSTWIEDEQGTSRRPRRFSRRVEPSRGSERSPRRSRKRQSDTTRQ